MNPPEAFGSLPVATPLERSIPTRAPHRLGLRPTPIDDRHLSRLAIVYVRQSTPQQILDHRESRERQYGLVDYAVSLGWPKDRILIIDEDQGHSGQSAEWRTGFHRLLAEVTMDHVGLILGIEMSRIARCGKDWHHLLEMCAVFGTILADEDGIYDPRDSNDRLLLGLKGNISEYEIVIMHNRLERARLSKAKRGELILDVPCGYVKLPGGEVAFDPDEQVQSTVKLIFDKFDELGSCRRLHRHLLRNHIRLGIRVHRGPRRGHLEWHVPTPGMLSRLLHHPIYAGAYSYGRRRVDHKRSAVIAGKRKLKMRPVPMSEWMVLQQDRIPAYITWDRYLANQQRLLQNQVAAGFSRSASHRQGPADESAGLRGLWPADVCQLPEQVDRLLRLYAAEERGFGLLRAGSRGGGRSGRPTGFAGLGAGHDGVEPQSDPGCPSRA